MDIAEELARQKNAWIRMIPNAAVSRHPYGFLIVRLNATVDRAKVRFNVWLKEYRPEQAPSWPIHSHEVAMSSYVIRGRLENTIWPEPRFGFGEPLYLASYTETSSILTKSDIRVSEGQKVTTYIAEGKQYEVEKGLFHATWVPEDAECLTLCLFHDEENAIGTVLGRDGYAPRIEFERLEVTSAAAEAARAAVMSTLS